MMVFKSVQFEVFIEYLAMYCKNQVSTKLSDFNKLTFKKLKVAKYLHTYSTVCVQETHPNDGFQISMV